MHTKSSIHTIDAIVLAAGTSSRMGKENKLLLLHENKPLIQHCLNQMSHLPFNKIILVTGYQESALLSHIDHKEILTITHNPNFETGQTSSIQTGLKSFSENSTHFMICLSDMPLLSSSLIEQFIDFSLSSEAAISRPFVNGVPGHPVLFNKKFKDELMACTDSNGCRTVIQNNKGLLKKYESTDIGFIRDIDLQQDKKYLS